MNRFNLGHVVATPGSLEALREIGANPLALVERHHQGDWGDLGEDDKRENEFSVDKYLRIFSAYQLTDSLRVWVITEADRSATTVLLPSEY